MPLPLLLAISIVLLPLSGTLDAAKLEDLLIPDRLVRHLKADQTQRAFVWELPA